MQANKHSYGALFFLFGANLVKIEFFIKLAEFFYKFTENREFLIGRFLPYKLGIETPDSQIADWCCGSPIHLVKFKTI